MHSQSVEVQFTFRTDFFFSNSNHHTKYHTKWDLFLSKSAKIKLETKADSVPNYYSLIECIVKDVQNIF